METELLLVVMAGVVLSLFLIVGEIAALRKRAKRIYARLGLLYRSRRIVRLALELCLITAFFLVQPVIVAFLVALALDGLNPDFSVRVLQELQKAL